MVFLPLLKISIFNFKMQLIQGFLLLAVVTANQKHPDQKQNDYVDYMEKKAANETNKKFAVLNEKHEVIGNLSKLQTIAKKEKRGNKIKLL